jgi:hypothetical protein
MTLHPVACASAIVTWPTGPMAPETKTVSPFWGLPMNLSPYQAVCPGMPAEPTQVVHGSCSLFSRTRRLSACALGMTCVG